MKKTGVNVSLRYTFESQLSDPQYHPVLIVGQLRKLKKISFNTIKHKFANRVTEEIWTNALSSLSPTNSDTVSLYLNLANVATLPEKFSRHNSSARPHALMNCVKNFSSGSNETVIVVCKYNDLLASAAAVARAYPLFSRKTQNGETSLTEVIVDIEFIIIEDENIVVEQSTFPKISTDALVTISDGIRLAQRIVDTPCSQMNVDMFLRELKMVADEYQLTLKVIKGEELQKLKMNGIWSVGQGSHVGPALAILTYKGAPNKTKDDIAWVGKGIVYDTGGLSIKDRISIQGMKRDCGGAAAILGALQTAVRLKVALNIHGIFCLAENNVGPKATRPDDIYPLYSGRTVEINNTDAEGRLVLADGVAYASKDLEAAVIIDMATLTAAQGVATGKYHGAVLTNNERAETMAVQVGKISGDLTFPIPFCPELHFSEFNSEVADMKNSVADRENAQSSCAGLFVMAHIGFDFPGIWLHVDMAAPVASGERATGYGVLLLTLMFGETSADNMIKYFSSLPNVRCDWTNIRRKYKDE